MAHDWIWLGCKELEPAGPRNASAMLPNRAPFSGSSGRIRLGTDEDTCFSAFVRKPCHSAQPGSPRTLAAVDAFLPDPGRGGIRARFRRGNASSSGPIPSARAGAPGPWLQLRRRLSHRRRHRGSAARSAHSQAHHDRAGVLPGRRCCSPTGTPRPPAPLRHRSTRHRLTERRAAASPTRHRR